MVYCGKPSGGCKNCKTRRIKCDEVRPNCSQCIKSKRTCPGYPDAFDLIFRNETEAVSLRAQRPRARQRKHRASPPSQQPFISPVVADLAHWDLESSPSTPLTVSSDNDPLTPDITLMNSAMTYTSPPPPLQSFNSIPTSSQAVSMNKSWNNLFPSPLDSDPFLDLSISLDTPTKENQNVLPNQKAVTSVPQDARIWEDTTSTSSSFSGSLSNTSPSSSPRYSSSFIWSIPAPQRDTLVSYFFHSHVLRVRHPDSQRGFLELLGSTYYRARPDSLLHTAVNAVALACLGSAKRSTSLKKEARRRYGTAMVQLAKEIESNAKQGDICSVEQTNGTLMTMLLFSLCEQVTSGPSSDIGAWTRHIQGAISLLRIQALNPDFLANSETRSLFQSIRLYMIQSSLFNGTAAPGFPGPDGWECDKEYSKNGAARLAIMALKLPGLRSRAGILNNKSIKTETDLMEMLEIITESRKMDANMEQFPRTLPDAWAGVILDIITEEPEDIKESVFWPGPQIVYEDLSLAAFVVEYRTSRILINTIIRETIQALPAHLQNRETDNWTMEAVYVSQKMVNNICAAVPYFLGYGMEVRKDCSTAADLHSSVMAGIYFISLPILVAHSVSCIPEKQREWISGRFWKTAAKFQLIDHAL